MDTSYYDTLLTDLQKLGIALVLFGMAFISLGVLLLFDTALLALGNILMISGVVLTLGMTRIQLLLFNRNRIKSTLLIIAGLALVLGRWAKVGLLLEAIGGLSLVIHFLPFIKKMIESVVGNR